MIWNASCVPQGNAIPYPYSRVSTSGGMTRNDVKPRNNEKTSPAHFHGTCYESLRKKKASFLLAGIILTPNTSLKRHTLLPPLLSLPSGPITTAVEAKNKYQHPRANDSIAAARRRRVSSVSSGWLSDLSVCVAHVSHRGTPCRRTMMRHRAASLVFHHLHEGRGGQSGFAGPSLRTMKTRATLA